MIRSFFSDSETWGFTSHTHRGGLPAPPDPLVPGLRPGGIGGERTRTGPPAPPGRPGPAGPGLPILDYFPRGPGSRGVRGTEGGAEGPPVVQVSECGTPAAPPARPARPEGQDRGRGRRDQRFPRAGGPGFAGLGEVRLNPERNIYPSRHVPRDRKPGGKGGPGGNHKNKILGVSVFYLIAPRIPPSSVQ